jgi:chromosome segregation ATPase
MSDGEASQSWAVGTYTGEPDDWSVQHERKEQLLYKTRGMISDLKAQLAASQEQVEAANSQARENAEELEDQKREYEKQLNDLRRSVQDKDDELERLKRDAQRESTASNENSQRLNRALSDLQQQRSQNEHLSSLLAQARHERDKLQSERDSAYSCASLALLLTLSDQLLLRF